MKSKYYSDNESKSDKAGLAAGAATTAGGGALLVHTLRKKGKGKKPVKEVVEVIEKTPKRGGTAIVGKGRQHLGNWAGGGWMVEGTRDRVTRIGSKFARKFHSEIENENENMEIRRKLFSVIEDENGEERYYSTTEFSLLDEDYNYDDERLFSTGNDELDDILEEVYYSGLEDGYDYAYEEREYAEGEDKESPTGVAAAGAASAGGVYGIGKLRQKGVIKKAAKEARSISEEGLKNAGKVKKAAEEEAAKHVKEVGDRLAGEKISQSGFDRVVDKVAGALGIEGSSKKTMETAKSKAAGIRSKGKAEAEKLVSNATQKAKATVEAGSKKAASIGKKSKIGAAAVLGTSGLIAAGKAIKNSKKSE